MICLGNGCRENVAALYFLQSGAFFATACRPGPTSQVVSPLPNTLAGFNVNVQCSATSHVEGAPTLWVYSPTSTATQGTSPLPDDVERQMTVTIAQP